MRLICVVCGNYVHFEVDVEIVRSVQVTAQGITVEDTFEDDWNDTASSLRIGVIDVVDYCIKVDMEALRWDAERDCYVNAYITCARCGSRRVCVPYRDWSPPTGHVTLDEELFQNHHEFQWLRKERERYADSMPVL